MLPAECTVLCSQLRAALQQQEQGWMDGNTIIQHFPLPETAIASRGSWLSTKVTLVHVTQGPKFSPVPTFFLLRLLLPKDVAAASLDPPFWHEGLAASVTWSTFIWLSTSLAVGGFGFHL